MFSSVNYALLSPVVPIDLDVNNGVINTGEGRSRSSAQKPVSEVVDDMNIDHTGHVNQEHKEASKTETTKFDIYASEDNFEALAPDTKSIDVEKEQGLGEENMSKIRKIYSIEKYIKPL